MPEISLLLGTVVIFALTFDYINGFHDTANAIATVVSTRVLTPRNAIIMAAVLNFCGALVSVKVAKTIASGLVDIHVATQAVVLAAILGAIVWNLITWRFGIPSSSSHALVGGLVGAAVAASGKISAIIWEAPKLGGLKWKVLIPLVGSPVTGFVLGFGLMMLIFMALTKSHPGRITSSFRIGQLFSSAAMAFAHGQSDAQKSMGIITMALIAFGSLPKDSAPPLWVMLACAVAMAAGTAAGGWRIIKTMGHRIVRLEPVHGFAAETSAAIVLFVTAHYGMPVSTTHTIAGSIFGVGSSKRLSAVRWGVAQNMVVAWILTLPAAATVSAVCYWMITLLGAK